MAISDQNVITYGLKGKIGDLLVFRRQNGKTVVSKIPAKSTVPPTQLQIEVNDRFRLASKFAKHALQDPVLVVKYQQIAKKGQRAFNAAFSDFYSIPQISNPNGIYDGQVNTLLSVDAIDNYEIKKVSVQILQADGTVIEQGDATLQVNGITYDYTCSIAHDPSNCKVIYSASDWAGNTVILEV